MKMYYLANARMPNEKAHGIQIAKMCEAFLEAGIDLTLVLPRRGQPEQTIRDFYNLRVEVPTVLLPALDKHAGGPLLYYLSAVSFMWSYLFYFWFRADRKQAILYTVDLDHISYGFMPFIGLPYFSEMHGGKPKTLLHRLLFAGAAGIIPTNHITENQLSRTFAISPKRMLVEPNGVDLLHFSPLDKNNARHKLGLSPSARLALYVGRFFDWKGLEILPPAAELLRGDVQFGIVGGSRMDLERLIGPLPQSALHFYGEKLYADIPLWLSAADVLVVLGTKRDEQSYRYTSPMKVFEYMAMNRPIVASGTPALHDILSDRECFWYEPDSAHSLAEAIRTAVREEGEAKRRAETAQERMQTRSWEARAHRVQVFMADILSRTIEP